jgi:cytochrome c oxidase cbb3-type subunit 3
MPIHFREIVACIASSLIFNISAFANTEQNIADTKNGKAVYEYYCYQCHGYAGDAKTLTGAYVLPKPRDFTRTPLDSLSRDRMIDSVSSGRQGSAMVSFSSVLTPQQITSVVDYIRVMFMSGKKNNFRYHSRKNGWNDHDRYRYAYPYITGELSAGIDSKFLSPNQVIGKNLYLDACISCHDQPQSHTRSTVEWKKLTPDTAKILSKP